MSDTGIPQYPPPPPREQPQATSRTERVPGTKAELVNASKEIRAEVREARRPVRIEGEVVRQNRDGTTRIRTERGDIDVRLPPEQPPPQRGQRVEIEIPPGAKQQEVIVRPAPPERPPEIPVEQRHAPRPEYRTEITPVRIEVERPPPVPANTPTIRPIPLEQGQEIRLLPLSPTRTPDIIQPIIELIEVKITQQTQLAAQIAQEQIQAPVLTKSQPALSAPVEQAAAATALSQPALTQSGVILSEPARIILQEAPALNIIQPAPLPNLAPVTQTVFALEQAPITQTPLPVTPPVTQSADIAQAVPSTPQALLTTTLEPPPSPLLKQEVVEVRVIKTTPPNVQFIVPSAARDAPVRLQNIPSPVVQGAPQTQTAHVIGFIEESLPVVQFVLPGAAFDPVFVLQTDNPTLPVGTQIQVSAQATLPLVQVQTLSALPVSASFLTPEIWPVMEQIHQALVQAAPQTAQAMAQVTPNASNPAQLGPAALFFLAAIRSGDITGWLGDKAADLLRRDGKGNLLTRLTQEGAQLGRLGAEPVSQDWRGMSVPLFYQGEIQKMALYYKHDRSSQDDETEKGDQTRFILNLNLSNMGKLQLDGLARPKKLDLAVRTEQRFSEPMQMEMKRIYTNTLEVEGFSGEMSFQNKPEQWVNINVNPDLYRADA